MSVTNNIPLSIVNLLDGSAFVTAAAGLFTDMIPPATSALVFVWALIRVYETETIQCLLHRRKCYKGD